MSWTGRTKRSIGTAVISVCSKGVFPAEWSKDAAAISAGENINFEGASRSPEFDENGVVADLIIEYAIDSSRIVKKSAVQ